MNRKFKLLFMVGVCALLTCGCGSSNKNAVSENMLDNAASMENTTTGHIQGRLYEFEKKSDFFYTENTPYTDIATTGSQFGIFGVSGVTKELQDVDGYPAFEVSNGVAVLSYSADGNIVGASENEWHLVDDSSKKVNGVNLGTKLLKGAVITQISNDGSNWSTEQVDVDIVGDESVFNTEFYSTKKIQLMNGCFYRVIVAYRTECQMNDSKEQKKYIEVYEFYIKDTSEETAVAGNHANNKIEVTNIEWKNTKKDTGYSDYKEVDEKDPHYGWELGTFKISGYSDLDSAGDMYIVNSGDVPTLSFNLKQDIRCLNGNENLSISDDTNGQDNYFQVPKSNFMKGTLILQFTDMEGNKNEPYIYRDYLNLYAKKDSDALIPLWGDGDYEVALDYEIKDNSGMDSYENYRIFFSFKIRSASGNNSSANEYKGRIYEWNYQKGKYEFSETTPYASVNSSEIKLGTFSVSGNKMDVEDYEGFDAYKVDEVQNCETVFCYSINKDIVSTSESEWHIVEDKTKKVNGENLGEKVGKGALVLQSSKDGELWITDLMMTNIAGEETVFSEAFFEAKEIQLINGCFYRVLVAYELERKVDDRNSEYKKCLERYEFYLKDDTAEKIAAGAHPDNKMVLAESAINTGKDNGYSGNNAITLKDPHYGWNIGRFIIKGYTSSADDNDEKVFLKNAGDVITLDFELDQNIDCLNGKEKFTIADDTNGYDQGFGTEQTAFSHGALIIKFADHENNQTDPIIYTDYLSAYARTGAETGIKIFEEGDYEVALDYEIKDSSGPIPSYTNYRIFFKFKVRNGSNMVFAFDNETGSQLEDGSITETGFILDTAGSHYLDVLVKKYDLVYGENGITCSNKWNKTSSDKTEYEDEGIYVVTVTNKFQPNDVIQRFYFVGTDPNYKLLSGMQGDVESRVKELNGK